MVKSVLGVKHQGLRDWAIQRVSAILIAIYSVGLLSYLIFNPGLDFVDWRELFNHVWMKVASLIFLLALLSHAWVGVWTIFTDYIKCSVIRGLLNVIVLLGLMACFFWGFIVLWSV